MNDPRTDAIAREAARLIESSRGANIGQAIRAAADALGFRDAQLPGHGRVRQHAQALEASNAISRPHPRSARAAQAITKKAA